MKEIDASMAQGKGLSGIESVLGRLLYLAGGASQWLADLATNVERVFVLGEKPNAGFQWLQDLQTWFVEADIGTKIVDLTDSLQRFRDDLIAVYEVTKPLWDALDGVSRSLTGVGAGANLVLLAFGAAFLKPILLVTRAIGGLATVLTRSMGILNVFRTWVTGSLVGGWLLAAAQALGVAAGSVMIVYWGLMNLQGLLTGIRDWLASFGTWTQPVVDGLDWIIAKIDAATGKMAALIRKLPGGTALVGEDPAAAAASGQRAAGPSIPNPIAWIGGVMRDAVDNLVNGFETEKNRAWMASLGEGFEPDPAGAGFAQQTLDDERRRTDIAAAAVHRSSRKRTGR